VHGARGSACQPAALLEREAEAGVVPIDLTELDQIVPPPAAR
jgi:hypothetical protein